MLSCVFLLQVIYIQMKKEAQSEKVEMNTTVAEKENTAATMITKPPIMSKGRILKNLIVLCLGYFFLFSSYQALANLQSTLNIEDNLGVVSQSVIYAALIFSSLFLPKLIIRKFGCKITLVLCTLTYVPYIAANFYPAMETLVPAAILIGLGAAPLWSAKCTYLNEISVLYASQSSDTADVITARFFGIFFMVFQNTQIWGNLVSFFVLRPSKNEVANDAPQNYTSIMKSFLNDSSNISSDEVVCGADFCFGINENLIPPSNDKRYMLIGIYLGLTLLAAMTTALFLDTIKQKKEDDGESLIAKVAATLKHLKKPDQMFLVPITIFSGLQQGFILGDYSKAYVACAWGMYHVGLVFICFGVVDAVMSFCAGRLVKYVSRMAIMFVGAAGNLGVCIVLFLWEPNSDQSVVFFVLVGIWGLSDAIWQTQLNSFYGALFRNQEEAAYSNYRLWESTGFALAFLYSSFLCILPKISILIVLLFIGMVGYVTAEIRFQRAKHAYNFSST
ncbi:protein unc-93 homolog A-like isoform X1 [Argiope bruennichi]|uniref:protein unc-93 homolog A-like isoform X1 n=2 Tax=Argiope bruennichi TaxID=94029 RepID=UPI00249599C4|nr:protein unc-93 homolog A-like isoform X1 [Argiope bruennichi]